MTTALKSSTVNNDVFQMMIILSLSLLANAADMMNEKMTEETSLYQRLKENEEIARRFYEVEKKILSILKFKDLFEVLLAEIKGQFNIPYVWLTLIENSDALALIKASGDMQENLQTSINVVDRTTFAALIGNQTEPVLANEGLKPYFQLVPPEKNFLIKSLAIVPITMEGKIIGSLNQGDASPYRFEPGMDTSLLEQLATKVSLCLSNVTAHERLEFLAYHDPLTGLLNRRVMEAALQREVKRAQRYQLPLAVVFLDLDYFKNINDTYGHEIGDRILQHLAHHMTQKCRDTDILARFAGDEFVIILPETDRKQAETLLQRLKTHLDNTPMELDEGDPIAVSASYGIASTEDIADETSPEPADPAAALLKKSDERLYQKKAARKNTKAGH